MQPRPDLLMIDSFVKAIARWDREKDAFGCLPLLGLAEGLRIRCSVVVRR